MKRVNKFTENDENKSQIKKNMPALYNKMFIYDYQLNTNGWDSKILHYKKKDA